MKGVEMLAFIGILYIGFLITLLMLAIIFVASHKEIANAMEKIADNIEKRDVASRLADIEK